MSWKLFELLVQAAGYTVLISALSIVIGLAIGMIVAGVMLSRNNQWITRRGNCPRWENPITSPVPR